MLLPLKVNFSYFEIQIFIPKLESEAGESESAMQKICNRIRNPNPPIFWPDCHPWFELLLPVYKLSVIPLIRVDTSTCVNLLRVLKIMRQLQYQLIFKDLLWWLDTHVHGIAAKLPLAVLHADNHVGLSFGLGVQHDLHWHTRLNIWYKIIDSWIQRMENYDFKDNG